MTEEQLNRSQRRPSDPPESGDEAQQQQHLYVQMPRPSRRSSRGPLASSNTSSEDSFRHRFSGSVMYDDEFGGYPQSVAPGYNYARSIPVESVCGGEPMEFRSSEGSGPGYMARPSFDHGSGPSYMGRPSFIGLDGQMAGFMVEPDAPVMEEHQLIKWESKESEGSTEGLTDPDDEGDDDDDDFENSVGLCEENYREPPTDVGDSNQIVVRRCLEPPGDPPEEDSVQQVETTIVQSSPREDVRPEVAELEANILNQLALLDPAEPPAPSHVYNGYSHNFITVRDEHRFLMLYTFLKRHADQKIIIFFSTTKSTQYYAKLLQRLKFDARAAHNGQSKSVFLSQYLEFSKQCSSGILCVPDFQGNEFSIPPSCQWIIQFEPPGSPDEYIFRVGRVSSESSVPGQALLFVTPEQFGVLQYFKAAQVKFREYEIAKISQVQKDYVSLIRKDDKMRKFAREAYHAYLLAYASHEFRDVYNIHDLDQEKVALTFGFTKPPRQHVEDEDDDEKKEARKDPGDKRWKPVKNEKSTCWMKNEKTWKYAHSSKKKVIGNMSRVHAGA